MVNPAFSLIPEDMPVGITPIYRSTTVNRPIVLYDGPIELEQASHTLAGKGTVRFQWLPTPAVRFAVDLGPEDRRRVKLEPCKLHLLGLSWHAEAFVHEISDLFSTAVSPVAGAIAEFDRGKEQYAEHIVFHLSNFTDYLGRPVRNAEATSSWAGRSVWEAGEWQITIDKIHDSKRIFKRLRARGGFAITHVGKLQRSDRQRFAVTRAEHVFEALFQYLSFCRGAWIAPILPVGFDEHGDRVWDNWRGWKISGWRSVRNWFNSHSEEGLSKGFPGFYKRWTDEEWKEPFLLANHWYVEANMSAGGVEGSIILAQAGFELLGWTYLVESRSALSEKGYESLAAVDKLRLLLTMLQIPVDIPATLPTLAATAKAAGNNWEDGPQALTEIRNALVHGSPAKRRKVFDNHPDLVHEAWNLSLRYLELMILRLCDYNERYSNRVSGAKWKGEEVEAVPWV